MKRYSLIIICAELCIDKICKFSATYAVQNCLIATVLLSMCPVLWPVLWPMLCPVYVWCCTQRVPAVKPRMCPVLCPLCFRYFIRCLFLVMPSTCVVLCPVCISCYALHVSGIVPWLHQVPCPVPVWYCALFASGAMLVPVCYCAMFVSLVMPSTCVILCPNAVFCIVIYHSLVPYWEHKQPPLFASFLVLAACCCDWWLPWSSLRIRTEVNPLLWLRLPSAALGVLSVISVTLSRWWANS